MKDRSCGGCDQRNIKQFHLHPAPVYWCIDRPLFWNHQNPFPDFV